MTRTRVKICGITCREDADLAVRLGADAIGLNLFPGSRRYIAPAQARQIAQELPPFVEPVVLFVNEPLAQVLAVAEGISHTIQWHGDDPPLPPPWPCRFIPAFSIADVASLEVVKTYLVRCRGAGRLPAAILLDGHAPGQYGGTGQTAPWQLCADLRPGIPVILAGGLTAANVSEAIRIVRPYAVDAASGVESEPGRKDAERLRRFMHATLIS